MILTCTDAKNMRDYVSHHSKLTKRKFIRLSADIKQKCSVKLLLRNGKKKIWHGLGTTYYKMNYAQNLRKGPVKAKKDPHKMSTGYFLLIPQFYRNGNFKQFCLICSKLPFIKLQKKIPLLPFGPSGILVIFAQCSYITPDARTSWSCSAASQRSGIFS